MKKADKLTEVPKALTTIGKKVNELCEVVKELAMYPTAEMVTTRVPYGKVAVVR